MSTAQAPRKSRTGLKVTLGVLGLLLMCLVGVILAAVLGSGPDRTTTPTTSPGATGQALRDGQFEFAITKVQCGVPRIGTSLLGRAAQGQYCLVTLKITNTGDEARTFFSGNQYAYNKEGQRYSADSSADLYLPGQDLLADINPGNSVTGVVAFDIPKGARIVTLELHDSALSGGIKISITG